VEFLSKTVFVKGDSPAGRADAPSVLGAHPQRNSGARPPKGNGGVSGGWGDVADAASIRADAGSVRHGKTGFKSICRMHPRRGADGPQLENRATFA